MLYEDVLEQVAELKDVSAVEWKCEGDDYWDPISVAVEIEHSGGTLRIGLHPPDHPFGPLSHAVVSAAMQVVADRLGCGAEHRRQATGDMADAVNRVRAALAKGGERVDEER